MQLLHITSSCLPCLKCLIKDSLKVWYMKFAADQTGRYGLRVHSHLANNTESIIICNQDKEPLN